MAAAPDRAKSVFLAALEVPAGEARRAHLAAACAGDESLLREVGELLRHHEGAGAFLYVPAAPPRATTDLSVPPPEAAGTAWVGLVLAGRYKLLEAIGEGGMGSVWTAQQTEPVKRLVAVKLIKAGMDSKAVLARFEAERQALALMDHPNIAKVLDAGTAPDGRPFFVMELVKGVPITHYCDEHHLTPRQRLELFIPACQAIQHAHQKGVIHRDIKPSNVLVALYDGKPVPKVIDFGVAKATGQALTEKTLVTGFGAIVGTLEYMSPEQTEVNQLDVDTRSDIYSLGVLLYELLVGSPPFTKKDLEKAGILEMLRVIREQEPSKPSTKLSTAEGLPTLAANRGTEPAKLTKLVRGELDWIVMKCLEKDRDRRYETARALARDIERYLHDEPVQACPPSVGYRMRKLLRRHKGPLLAVALLVLVLVGGIIGTTWGLLRATDESARKGEALTQVRRTERAAKIDLSTFLLDKGLALCENGKVGLGLLWLARSLEVAPDDATDLQRTIRINLGAWSHQVSHLRGMMPEQSYQGAEADFSPDSKTLLLRGTAVRAWDTVTGQPLGPRLTLPHEAPAYVALGPDGKTALVPSPEGVWRFDLVTGQALGPPLRFEGQQWTVQFSRDRKIVVTKSKDNKTARLWDVVTGTPVGLPLLHPEGIERVTFSPDNKRVVTGGGKLIRLWDVTTGQPIGQPREGAGGYFSLDGKTVALPWADKVQLCNAATGALEGPPQELNSVRVRDGLFIPWHRLALWRRINGTPSRRGLRGIIRNGLEPGAPELVALSPAGGFVLTNYQDGTGQLWNTRTGQPVGAFLPHSRGRDETFSAPPPVLSERATAFSPDGSLYVTHVQAERTGRLYEVGTGKPHGRILVPLVPQMGYLLFSPDGRFMLAYPGNDARPERGCEFKLARTTGEVIGRETKHFPNDEIQAVAFSPDGRMILTVDDSPETHLWVAEEGKLSDRWRTFVSWSGSDQGRRPRLWNDCRDVVAFSPDGKTFLAGGGAGTRTDEDGEGVARLLDLERRPLGPPLPHPAPVQALAFSPDGKTLLTGCGNSLGSRIAGGEARLWDAASGRLIGAPFLHQGAVTAVAFSPNGKTILTGSADRSARLWDVATAKTICPPLAHLGTVRAVAFDRRGQVVLTGSEDGTARLWDAATGKPLGPPLFHDHAVTFVCFGPDGQSVLTSGRRQGLRRWEAAVAPLAGDVERLRLWVEVFTGSELDRDGVEGRLNHDTWAARRQHLRELGGPPRL
jgi:WD40 repeat protein/serine/threonine protein kinase